MTDKILKSLGMSPRIPFYRKLYQRPGSPELSDAAYDVVVSHLVLFARSGGVVTWKLWSGLLPQTRAALVEAFERVKAEDAAAIGMASQGPKQAANVLSAADGGDLACELALDEFSEKLARK